MNQRATLEVVRSRKPERQAGIPLPGTSDAVLYQDARQKLSVVETCNGDLGTSVSLRVEVITEEQVVTANRPNLRITIDIPLNEGLTNILATALDRAEEGCVISPDAILTPRDIIQGGIQVEAEMGFQDPSVAAVLDAADKQAEQAQVTGLEADAFGDDDGYVEALKEGHEERGMQPPVVGPNETI